MGFVGLEEDRALPVLLDAKNFAVIPRGDVQTPLRIELHVPDVLGFWIEKSFCGEFWCGAGALFARDSIYLAIG